jgi:cytochrome c oxidase cbb3-type subunit 3
MKTNFLNMLKKGSLSSAFLFLSLGAWAQSDTAAKSGLSAMTLEELVVFSILVFTIMISLIVLFTAFYALASIRQVMVKDLEAKGIKVESYWQMMMRKLTDAVPVNREHEVMLDHNYDGIKELNNHLPPWWVYMFYGTIVWGAAYMLLFHVIQPESFPLSAQEYENQMQTAAIQIANYKKTAANNIDEKTVKFVEKDKVAIEGGAKIYKEKCAACHGQNLEGGTGPNLTDEYWLHGGSINDVFKTIKVGIPAKGMISWEKQLRPEEMQNVASFILTKQGSKPANAKEPQGEKYVAKKN